MLTHTHRINTYIHSYIHAYIHTYIHMDVIMKECSQAQHRSRTSSCIKLNVSRSLCTGRPAKCLCIRCLQHYTIFNLPDAHRQVSRLKCSLPLPIGEIPAMYPPFRPMERFSWSTAVRAWAEVPTMGVEWPRAVMPNPTS